MQFSILGVPFKCTKDMFTWEKIRSTCFISWAITWRSFLISLLPTFLISPFHFILKNENEGFDLIVSFVYFVVSFLIYYYCKYVVLYKTPFRTMERKFIHKPNNLKFFSWYFWKPQLLSLVLSSILLITLFIIGVALWYFLPKSQTGSMVLMLVFAAAYAFVWICVIFGHVFIHGGTYGAVFEPVNAVSAMLITKKPSVLERIRLSFAYFFRAFWAGLLVNLYTFFVISILFATCYAATLEFHSLSLNNSQIGAVLVLFGLCYTIPSILVNYYIAYDALYKFPYRSSDRMYALNTLAPKRWSLKFLSTYILVGATKMSLTFLLTLFVQYVLNDYVMMDWVLYLVAYCVSAIVVDISFITFGAWGFVPVRKETTVTESTSTS